MHQKPVDPGPAQTGEVPLSEEDQHITKDSKRKRQEVKPTVPQK